ncbi:MAG: hypothetical protein CML20_06890 [Rheinheimera sp.]|nr:hypothetical protein [Rheinheimera sp.]|tara:strand:+ start:5235 stop:5636 length:402 start_codon:yes stop_codon:yes gene_type:complete
MAKHLTDIDIHNIVSLLDGWDSDYKLTWDNLCELALKKHKISSTRQTIQKPIRIKTAFKERKEALKSGEDKPKIPPSLSIAAKRIDKLANENSRLERENDGLLAQFVVWQYNAYANGMTIEQLNRAMPAKPAK